MWSRRTFCLVAMLAVAQVGLARAEAPGAATFITFSCALPLPQCRPASSTDGSTSGVTPAAGIAIRKQTSGAPAGPRPAEPFIALQMNLCNSGVAGCFTGHAAAKAARLVLERAPTLVTVNEACESDVSEMLLPAMLARYPNEWIFWTFAPAARRGIGVPVRCTPDPPGEDRGRFGNGAVGRLFVNTLPRFSFDGGLFPDERDSPQELQDKAHAELRSWVCAEVEPVYRACTTHLDDPSATGAGTLEQARVAFNQCRYLMESLSPGLATVMLGDLNLGSEGSASAAKYSVEGCAPQGWSERSDGGVQHALANNGFAVATVESASMAGTTDHPALIVVFRRAQPP